MIFNIPDSCLHEKTFNNLTQHHIKKSEINDVQHPE